MYVFFLDEEIPAIRRDFNKFFGNIRA